MRTEMNVAGMTLLCPFLALTAVADVDIGRLFPPVGERAERGGVAPSFGGRLSVSALRVELQPLVASQNWWFHGGTEGFEPSADGTYAFVLHPDDGQPKIDGTLRITTAPSNALHVAYGFTPRADATLNALMVQMTFRLADTVGWSFRVDGASVALPTDDKTAVFHASKARLLEIVPADAEEPVVFRFAEPTSVCFQSGRPWGGQDFSVRLVPPHAKDDRKWPGGVNASFAFDLTGAGALDRAAGRTYVPGEDPAWVPVTAEYEVQPGSALDFRALVGNAGRAGRFGRVVAKGPHFEFENLPGVAQRFYGVNFCLDYTQITPADCARTAANIARAGYNAVRIHHHDGRLVDAAGDPASLRPDARAFARLDALLAACITNGLYVTTDLFVSRGHIAWKAVGIDRPGEMSTFDFKFLVPGCEGAFSNLCAFARVYLGHVNTWTGLSLAAEPAFVCLSIVNEAPLESRPPSWYLGIPEWKAHWEKWLAEKKSADPVRWAKVSAVSFPGQYGADVQSAAFLAFLADREARCVRRMRDFLAHELNCRVPLSNQNCGGVKALQFSRQVYDYVDTHYYVDHPQFLGPAWTVPSKCCSERPFVGDKEGAHAIASLRLEDRPFTVTEMNYCPPGRYRSVAGLAAGAEAALQDWSGMLRFAWIHSDWWFRHPEMCGVGGFDIQNDPLARASDLAVMALFLRGDLAPAERSYVVPLDPDGLSEPALWLAESAHLADAAKFVWRARVATSCAKGAMPSAPTVRKDDAVQVDRANDRMTVTTARTCGGFAEAGTLRAGALEVSLSGSPATVWATALDGKDLARSSRILFVHLTEAANRDARFMGQDMKVLLKDAKRKTGLPLVMRRGRAEVKLAWDGERTPRVYALGMSGRRRHEVAVERVGNSVCFRADVAGADDGATYLYEIASGVWGK